jgi:hypothetical protein
MNVSLRWLLLVFPFASLVAEPPLVSLFEGDLRHWDTWLARPGDAPPDTPPLGRNHDPRGVFSVVELEGEPVLRISGEVFGGLTSRAEFANYRLRVIYRWGEVRWQAPERPRNSGLLYHAHGEHGAFAGAFMASHELQMMEGNVGDYIALGPVGATVRVEPHGERAWRYAPAGEPQEFVAGGPLGRRALKAVDAERPAGEWNTIEVVCWQDRAAHYVNGQRVLVLTASRRLTADGGAVPLQRGRVQIQSEGAELFVRAIEWQPLDGPPPELSDP